MVVKTILTKLLKNLKTSSQEVSDHLALIEKLETPETSKELLPTLKEIQEIVILERLKLFEGNRLKTARSLGIGERTLYRFLELPKKLNLMA